MHDKDTRRMNFIDYWQILKNDILELMDIKELADLKI